MKNYKLIPRVALWVLLLVGIVISVMFYVGGSEGTLEVAGDFLGIPKFSNIFLFWNYILVALVVLVTLGVVIWEFIKNWKTNRKKAYTTLGVAIGFALLVIICWFLGSPDEVKILGYEGTENVGPMAQLSDMMMYLTYILVVATVLALVWGVVHTKRLK